MFVSGMMGEGDGETSTSACSHGTPSPSTSAHIQRRDGAQSWQLSEMPAGMGEGLRPGRPPTHQPPHTPPASSERGSVAGEPQTMPPGDADVSPHSSEVLDDEFIEEVMLWLEGATGEDDGSAQTSDDSGPAVTNLLMLPTHSFGAGEEEGQRTTMSRESQQRSSESSSGTSFRMNVTPSDVSGGKGADKETQGTGWTEHAGALAPLRPSSELISEEGFVTPSPAPQRVQDTGPHQSSESGIQGTGSVQAIPQFPAPDESSVRYVPTSDVAMEWWPVELELELQTPAMELASETSESSASFSHFGSPGRDARGVQSHGSAVERGRSRLTSGSAGREEASSKAAAGSRGSRSYSGVSAGTSSGHVTLGDAMPSFRDVGTVGAVSGSDVPGSVASHPGYLGLQERGVFRRHRTGRLHAATFHPLTITPSPPQSSGPLRERGGISAGTLSPSAFTADSAEPSGTSSSERVD
ncbi:hypothetical protein TGMAS_417260 [Toxoplasma gondii MAS]|uniref:Uncharacterized protein n=1 Tax=Toxoplasma gondii MAS TaxID=943118 RepID=A0A086PJ81_TOXGO|nr:hypothetical protein TGMAS_417260 [Toxoplasma gondii MAS]